MVRETRHLWVGNLPDNIREDRIREHFKRYGRVQSVKLLPRSVKEETGENTTACTVAFMDIKSASKAHTAEHKIEERTLTTEYYEPAAIPSAASPQNTNSTYATSPGSTRFTNNHGVSEEHANFPERFYDRNNSRVTDAEYIRRTSYHDSRGRNRDRGYRNGPYNNVIDRHRPLNSTWSYDSSRSYNSETGYGTTPSDTNDRRSSDSQSTKKKTKSRSGSRSVSPSGSVSSRSPTRSRSQSSSSSSSSTTSQASSSTSSPKSRRVALSANASHQPVVHSDDRRPLAICVRNLPLRSSDTSLKDGLFHEYKKHGKVTWVKIVGQGTERHAIVCFKKPEDVDKALEVSYDKLFFGCKIEVAPYQGYDVDDNELRPYEAEIDEFHPKATRTLFIGNLEKDVTASDLRKHFDQFGEIIEIDIKKQGAVSSYAFCQYSDIISVVKAIRAMDGEHLGNNRIKLGFGKSMPTNCVWVDGVVDSVNEKYLTLQFDSFGPITQVMIDRDKGQALIFYDQVVNAQAAVAKMRGVNMRGRKMQVDFASRECQEAFYEHLEKQGHSTDRTNFEERRDSAIRTFDATVPAGTTRFTRYETPTRPRTASYSNRSNVTTGQCNASTVVHSPSTPGSVTPRGSGARSRLARFSEYYEQNVEYGERRYRSYDEYSQGSAASHEDGYEHDYSFNRESPSRVDTVETRSLPHNSEVTLSFPQPEIRNLQNLQKERYHLLEQLEDYPSSGDELVSPKKRMRLDVLEGPVTNDVIIEANRDHRKVMEVRRTSEASLKHHSRRPSIDSKHGVGIDRVPYMPHTVCKRRKTAGSDTSSRIPHHELSGSESVGSSRPGTPLCDEKPENFPTEPRRTPRDREGPLSLPLPRFAAQIMGKGSVSVAGIKGQKDNILSSPPPAVTSPRICNPVTPSLAQVPPPASPPPRPPSLSSNSSDSDVTPPSPSLDERIRSLDEKYEKWSGSRAVSAAGSEALAKLDASASERFRFSYKLLDLDLKELQPSEIVKSVMAKPSVFDEDSKRLENVGEKYDIGLFPKTPTTLNQISIPASPLPIQSSVLKVATITTPLPKTPPIQSPRSSGSNITTAKGLQYPFPSHPPLLPVISAPSTPTPPPLQTQSASTATSRVSHSDNRLKLCVNTTSTDGRTSSKLSATRSGSVMSNTTQIKVGDCIVSKNGVNIPLNPSENVSSAIISSNTDSTSKMNKNTRESKLMDKSDKIVNRRDSVSSSGSPRSEIRNRRNSESSGRKSEVGDKQSEHCDTDTCEKKLESIEKIGEWRKEQQRLEIEKVEKDLLEKERAEKERSEKEIIEKEKLERERLEKERLEKELREKERTEREKSEQEKIEREKLEHELKREKEERERRERDDRERREKEEEERLEREKREKEEREKREREERERKGKDEQEKLERDRKREEERKHKDENQEKRKDEYSKHCGESKHKDNLDVIRNERSTKEQKSKESGETPKKESNEFRNNHESRERHNSDFRKDDKLKHHFEREIEKKKDSCKENRENNLHEKSINITPEVKENSKPSIEIRHFSLDLDKNKIDLCRRKERNNSLPVNAISKRRLSCQDSLEMIEEIKKIKLSQEHKKISDRRDSKDMRSEEKIKIKHKNNIAKIIEDKLRQEKFNSVKEGNDEKRRDKDKDEKHKHKQKVDKQKSKDKSKDKDSPTSKTSNKDVPLDKEFLARLDLQSIEESEKREKQRKDAKEKRKQENSLDPDEHRSEEYRKSEDRKKEKRASSERKSRDENICSKMEDKKNSKKERTRKITHSSDAATDSDEPKKQQPHSIFDIVDDEPAYISMYDKVKARSCKNMQKQEEEKRQEKLKAKFNQLKQSRAKREEKKRSTSWDEDSDSDHDRRERSIKSESSKGRKSSKVLITSSDDDTISSRSKPRRKRDIYTDSDSDKNRNSKNDNIETSEDETTKSNKSIVRKTPKSRIASDTSDDDFKTLRNKIKSEIFSDSELEHPFIDLDEKPHKKIKDEDSIYAKKEKRAKHQELTTEQISVQIFGESPVPDTKQETKFDNSRIFGDVSSAEETHDIKKEKSDVRKKHKKKQKRQKHSLTSEEETKLELTVELIKDESIEKMKNSEKKKPHSKKDKKKDKSKDDEKHKDKSRKSKKSKSELGRCDSKRDGKMENIFGSFSDDSEHGSKDPDRSDHSFLDRFGDEKLQMYASDSDSILHIEKEIHKSEEKEQRKEEHKKRKEKKRREKEKRLKEEEINENSMDYIDMGKQLEANIKDDSNDILDTTTTSIKSEGEERGEDIFRFTEGDESQEIKIETEKKEGKEKKKKRKKSKDEKHKHHHHHHDKNKTKIPEVKKEFDLTSESIVSEEKSTLPSPSLPSILELPSSLLPKIDSPIHQPEYSTATVVNCIPKISTGKDKKRDKLIPGFGTEIDEKVHETAIKSISEFEVIKTDDTTEINEEEVELEKPEPPEEKPRVVISQEETEDAVAALLGESFGGNEYSICYSDDQQNLDSTEPDNSVPEDNIAEDLEEMRQAVQSLNSTDLEIKPETPQSEHELQIDTDTDEQEEISLRYDHPPKTPDMDLSQPPKTPDIPTTYFRSDQTKPSLIIKATNINSPPSLTPLKPKPLSKLTNQPKEVVDTLQTITNSCAPNAPITEPLQKNACLPIERKTESAKIEKELLQGTSVVTTIKSIPTISLNRSHAQSVLTTSDKPNTPSLSAQSKQDLSQIPTIETSKHFTTQPLSITSNSKPSTTLSYNMQVHMQYNTVTQSKSTSAITSTELHLSPTTTTIAFNRLPITPVMMSKSFHQTTMPLPQPINAKTDVLPNINIETSRISSHQSNPPFLINSQPQTRMVLQNVSKSASPQVTTRLIPPINYGSYSSTISKTSSCENTLNTTEPPRLVPSTYPPVAASAHVPPSVLITSTSITQPSIVSHPIAVSSTKMNIIQETPRLVSISSFNNSPSIIQSTSKLLTASELFVDSKLKPKVHENKSCNIFEPVEEICIKEKQETVVEVEKKDTKESQPQLPSVSNLTEELSDILKEQFDSTATNEIKVEPIEKQVESKVKEENKEHITSEQQSKGTKSDLENMSVIKKMDKYEDDKGETESIESDISKERLSADLVNKDDGLDSKEDSDYWSAKEVNIDSVIKKVDALCSADELSDRSSEIGKDDWFDNEIKSNEDIKVDVIEAPQDAKMEHTDAKMEHTLVENVKIELNITEEEIDKHLEEKDVPIRGGRRGGRTRGRKTRGIDRGGVQTRRAKGAREEPTPPVITSIVVAKRGGRGGRCKNERKTLKCELESSDVYEFRDDADENSINKDRPRLILTIKSPAPPNANNANTQTTVVKEVLNKEIISSKPEMKEDFVSPINTRKSRRLQERDISRNSVDDTIEDVVRNTAVATRSATVQLQMRRSARQTANKVIQETPRKSPRSGVRRKDRHGSENTDDSSEEKFGKNESPLDVEVNKPFITPGPEPVNDIEEEKIDPPKEKPHEGLKAAVLRRVKGEMNQQEPMTLIDPVTGLLIPMRECEEGRYIPVPGALNQMQAQAMKLTKVPVKQPVTQVQCVTKPVEPLMQSVITSPVIQQPKPQSLKAHVLSSQAARVVVSQQQQQPQKLITISPTAPQTGFVSKSNVPISQNLNINVSSPSLSPAHVSPRPVLQSNITKTIHNLPTGLKMVQQAPPSPNHTAVLVNPPKQHILQPNNKQPQATISKGHHIPVALANANQQMVNTQLAHMKQVVGKGPVIKPHGLHPQPQILTGAVASPPLKQTHLGNPQQMTNTNAGRLIQGSASVPIAGAKGSMEPPKVEVSIAGCVMVPHPSSSPQGQQRHVLQTGLPIATFEASLGEAMTHFPPGSVKLRTPHELLPAHYMHPQHVMYQQYLRQSYHLPRSPLVSGNIEKTGDGQEGEEAPVELRRPGSVGLALTGRSPVPLSLQSPHDRTTDSPQVGQVYNIHNSRLQQHYHAGRYYEQANEPPPAHRPLTSHGSLAALGNDRPINHMGTLNSTERPIATHLSSDRSLGSHLPSDRPLSNHLPPDRPLSSHTTVATSHINSLGVSDRPLSSHLPDRPLSSNHGFPLGTGLGAAGNLMGAVARHIGAEAPATQRGLQAATPPHASQVPPQAESLLMLLKQYPCMWQGLLALKNDQAAVQMYFVSGNDQVAKCSLPKNIDGSTPPLRIFQRMRLEPPQVEGVARKMQMENEHCMLLALPCGHDHMDVLKQSTNLSTGFITYLQQKQAAGIVNVAAPGTTQPPAYVVHIFPSCDFVNENLRRIAPNLLERVSDIAHLLIVITTV
ncbi:hypothetical protein FQA39_LY01476 [Lamprigera yunnana]|nr:hypothetical protein FQA39_LY01476 [Lamprigera yunnana]